MARPNLTLSPTLEENLKGAQDFQRASQDFWKLVNDDWKEEFVQPAKDSFAPTAQKVGRFMKHVTDLRKKAKSFKSEFKNSAGSGVIDALKERAKSKLNASTGMEAVGTFLQEAKRRISEANATEAMSNPAMQNASAAILKLKEQVSKLKGRSLVDILQIDTTDPAWQLASKGVDVSKKVVHWVNDTANSGDVPQRILDLLKAIPEDRGKQIKDFVLPFIVSNAAIKDLPMTKTERGLINFGILAGVMSPDKLTPEIAQASFDRSTQAIKKLKEGTLSTEPLYGLVEG